MGSLTFCRRWICKTFLIINEILRWSKDLFHSSQKPTRELSLNHYIWKHTLRACKLEFKRLTFTCSVLAANLQLHSDIHSFDAGPSWTEHVCNPSSNIFRNHHDRSTRCTCLYTTLFSSGYSLPSVRQLVLSWIVNIAEVARSYDSVLAILNGSHHWLKVYRTIYI
jgi:hypothetical protein